MAVRRKGVLLMACSRARIALCSFVLVVMLACVVQWLAPASGLVAQDNSPSAAHPSCPATEDASTKLPGPVQEMREAILTAVRSGNVEDLRTALEWNELKPHVADEPVDDAIAYWKKISGDGEGREILAIIAEILECDPAVLPIGKDIENSNVFVWPALAETDLSQLEPHQEVALYRLVRPDEVKAMREARRWQWWRLAIGADGTWHSFHKSK